MTDAKIHIAAQKAWDAFLADKSDANWDAFIVASQAVEQLIWSRGLQR